MGEMVRNEKGQYDHWVGDGKESPRTLMLPADRSGLPDAPDPEASSHSVSGDALADLYAALPEEARVLARPALVRNGHQFAPEGECAYCDQQAAAGNSFFPPHRRERKSNCGGGSDFHHCSCSACF